MKRILIDGRFIGVGESISRYTLEILQGILKLDKKNKYTLLMRPQGKKEFHKFFSNKLKSQNLQPVFLDIPHYSLPEQTRLLKYLNKKKFDLIHFTQFNHPIRYKGVFIVSVHDLTLLGHLHRMNPLKRLGFKGVMSSAIKDSSQIITISNYSKKDIVETYKIDPKKISVTYLGVDNKFHPPGDQPKADKKINSFKRKYNIEGDYILYTGMWKKHKNLIRLMKAFEIFIKKDVTTPARSCFASSDAGGRSNTDSIQKPNKLPAINPQLVLVGKIDHEEPEVLAEISRINKEYNRHPSELGRHGAGKSLPQIVTNNRNLKLNLQPIITTGFVDEEELPVAYSGALAYIIPSLSEGFGLPPLEAMACGTPVLSSKVSAMPEILGDATLYFDPYKVDDIAKKIEMIVTDEKLRSKYANRGLEHVKKYDWSETARKTLDVYFKILKA